MNIRIEGLDSLEAKLTGMQNADFSDACQRAATEIYNMGQTQTPKKTGELRLSMAVNQNGKNSFEVGYAKEYAPHVEYGHRVVVAGNQVGYVEGQYFMKKMAEAEGPKFKKYVFDQLVEAK